MTTKLSQEKLEEIRTNFDYFDNDNNGMIEIKEFISLLQVIEPTSTKQQAEEGFKIIDDDDNGVIDFDEFLVWWESCWWQF
ncbi:MAG: calmodulin [Enterobacterales bacterium]|jgi:calmodulin